MPGVNYVEKNITAPTTPVIGVGTVGLVIQSVKGDVNKRRLISSLDDLKNVYGVPNTETLAKDFEVARTILEGGNNVIIVSAVDEDTAELSRVAIDFDGDGGSVLVDSIDEVGDEKYFNDINAHTMKTNMDIEVYAKNPSEDLDKLSFAIAKPTESGEWIEDTSLIKTGLKFNDEFEFGPAFSNDEIAFVVMYDGSIVEKFIVSVTQGKKDSSGRNIFITDYLNENSDYVNAFVAADVYSSLVSKASTALANGSRGSAPDQTALESAYSLFSNKDDVEIDYITDGNYSGLRSYILTNIAEARKDCILYTSPASTAFLTNGVLETDEDTIVADVITDKGTLTKSSYLVYNDNYCMRYNPYIDKRVWIPSSAFIIKNKLRVNTRSNEYRPAAGVINGLLSSIDKLAYNPNKANQDLLYKNDINCVIRRTNVGFMVNGQKTTIGINTGVSRVNIRETFRLVARFVTRAAEAYVHGFNNPQTRARFVSQITPFLNAVVEQSGLKRYRVIADETNNTNDDINNFNMNVDILLEGQRPIENINIRWYVDMPILGVKSPSINGESRLQAL